jgi:RNA polymerase sigma-70 factor (ECF subfamily)
MTEKLSTTVANTPESKPMHTPTEEELSLKDNPELLNDLLKKMRPELLRHIAITYLSRHSNPNEEAEEVVQNTYISVIKHIDSYRAESSFRTWVFHIAKNAALDKNRKENNLTYLDRDLRKNQPLVTEEGEFLQIADKELSPEQTYRGEQLEKIVLKFLLGLKDPANKDAFLLQQEGHSFKEISHALNINETAAKVKVFRVREKLKQYLKKLGIH